MTLPVSLAERIDFSLLAPQASEADVTTAAETAARLAVRGLCVTPRRIAAAARVLSGSGVILVGVVGFPSASSGREARVTEAAEAVRSGAREIDVVLPWGEILEGRHDELREEAASIFSTAGVPWKGIVEASELSDEAIRRVVLEILAPSGASFLKTGTGVHGRPISAQRIAALRAILPPPMRLKVSGGIRDREAAETAVRAGADVVGTSRAAEILGSRAPG